MKRSNSRASPLILRNGGPKWRLCQLHILPVISKHGVPSGSGQLDLVFEYGIVPQIHSLDAKGCRNGES